MIADLKAVHTDEAPAAIGPYSQAVVANGMVYCSGQIPMNPKTGQVEVQGIAAQTACALDNLQAVLRAAGASLQSTVKLTVYLKDMDSFAAMNEVYERHMAGHRPARAAVEVSRLPRDVLVEIDAIAVSNGG